MWVSQQLRKSLQGIHLSSKVAASPREFEAVGLADSTHHAGGRTGIHRKV